MAKVAFISGYKPQELGIFDQKHPGITFIKKAIRRNLETLLEEGLEWVIISGQLGVELWAAEEVFDMQMEGYDELKLAVITPFHGQESNWSDRNKEWYESIIMNADFVDSITKKPYENPSQFQLKNQFFLHKSDILILLYDTEKEGSPKYLFQAAKDFQEKKDLDLRLITFYDLQLIVEEDHQ